jgi:CheY-specific phosphatase CheX
MEPDDATICEITDQVCATLLHRGVTRGRSDAPPDAPFIVGRVRIHGSWEGAVTLACASPLARRAAGALLEVPPEAVSGDDVRDALGELTNIIVGNVKALLPAPSRMSIPAVRECAFESVRDEPPDDPGADRSGARELWFSCEGEALVVSLVPMHGAAAPGAG